MEKLEAKFQGKQWHSDPEEGNLVSRRLCCAPLGCWPQTLPRLGLISLVICLQHRGLWIVDNSREGEVLAAKTYLWNEQATQLGEQLAQVARARCRLLCCRCSGSCRLLGGSGYCARRASIPCLPASHHPLCCPPALCALAGGGTGRGANPLRLSNRDLLPSQGHAGHQAGGCASGHGLSILS